MGLILLVGSALQGAIGFGFGLFGVPVLIIIGFEPYEAIATVGTCAFSQALVGVIRYRREVAWKQVFCFSLIGILFQPLGVYFLGKISSLGSDQVRQVFGLILLVMVG